MFSRLVGLLRPVESGFVVPVDEVAVANARVCGLHERLAVILDG